MPRILLVEDDTTLSMTIAYNLRQAGHDVLLAHDGGQAITLARSEKPDLVVLDLMLPGMGGLDVCRILRRDGDPVPIIMLTARDAEVDRIVGLEVGADDYVSKPFSMRELLARVSAMLRRKEMLVEAETAEEIAFDGITINLGSRRVTRNGAELKLNFREFELLAFMARNRGRALSRAELMEKVWGYDHAGVDRTVDVHIRWLRQKLEKDPSAPELLVTVRGLGYRLE